MNGSTPLRVWVDKSEAGLLAREGQGHIFSYQPGAASAVSLTMPIRLESWASAELHPIFQMNLPEGELLEVVRRAIAKIIGDDELSILLATGGNQIGRNRFSGAAMSYPPAEADTDSLESLLTYPDTRELFHELIKRHALRSGISGVQPKVLLDLKQKGSLAVAGYIVKAWGEDFPQLAANEYFCMTAARAAGLPVAEFHLAENGGLFVMKRFDLTPDAGALGFEDLCSLQGLGTRQKYRSTCERVAKSLKYFVAGEHLLVARRQFFTILVLSSCVRNGDAHLKNYGVLYSDPQGPVTMAPCYDIVTTCVYLKNDVPALALDGTKKWWSRKMLERFALAHLSLTIGEINRVIERTSDAVAETAQKIPGYIKDHPEFKEVGEEMIALWEDGVGGF